MLITIFEELIIEHVYRVQEYKNHNFVALIDKLISKIGIGRVIAGSVSHIPSTTKETTKALGTSESYYPRAWLAAEILCTWKWQGGSAVSSFLPLLTAYIKSEDYSLKEGLLDSIINILLDGALVHGVSGEPSELESIEEPFLRALVSLLLTLCENNIWGKQKAISLFEVLVNKLFVGETVNSNCLRILPLVMSVLVRPLSIDCDDSVEGNKVIHSIEDWLRTTLSFPPLSEWQTGKGDLNYVFIS